MNNKYIKLFLRFAIGVGFISAVADRLGYWPEEMSVWGNWESFLNYTGEINPWLPEGMLWMTGVIATVLEVLCGLSLLIGFKTSFFAKISGFLMLVFALAMTFSSGIKGALDYSVFAASAGAFALGTIKEKYFEIDNIISKNI